MLSKKMAFSLTSLITIFALAFVVTPVMAQVAEELPPISFSITEIAGDDTANPPVAAIKNPPDVDAAKDGHQLRLGTPLRAVKIQINTYRVLRGTGAGGAFGNGDATGKILILRTNTDTSATPATVTTTVAEDTGSLARVDAESFSFTVTPEATTTKFVISVPEDAFGEHPAASLLIEFLGTITLDEPKAPTDPDRPRVVSIQRLRPGTQTVVAAFEEAEVTGAFDVRIVLTEKAHDFKVGHINVTNGTASGFINGAPFPWFGTNVDATTARERNNANRAYTIRPHPIEGMYQHNSDGVLAGVPQGEMGFVPLPTGDDNMYYQYQATITPHRRAKTVKVSVKEFHDNDSPYKNYYQPVDIDTKPNGREELRLTVNIPLHDLEAGYRRYLPHVGNPDFPKNGYYILTRDDDGSFINVSNYETADEPDRENKPKEQTVAELKYNVRATPASTSGDRSRTPNEPQDELPNLETFLANNGTIHLVSYVRDGANPKYKMGDLYISEVMWGTDASQDPVSNSNWIEIHNTGDKIDVGEQLWALWFFEAHETVPTNADYHADGPYEGPTGQPGEIIDVIGTKRSDTGLSWSLAGKGQNGRSNIDIARAEQHVLTPTTPLISMYRVMEPDTSADAAAGAMVPADGTFDTSWMQTDPPSVNLKPGRENAIIATPGSPPFPTPDTLAAAEQEKKDLAAAEQEKKDLAAEILRTTGTYPVKGDGRVYISEVMFAGGGTLPQWIEIVNGDRAKEFNLSGWTITVDNATGDTDVDVSSATFTIPPGTMIAPSERHDPTGDNVPSTILVVTERGRNSLDSVGAKASSQIINLAVDNENELIIAGILKGKYTLLSDEAFQITLAPPVPEATKPPAGETSAAKAERQAAEKKSAADRKAAVDTVGNLGADGTAAWALPVSEGGARSSIIRRHIQVSRGPTAPEEGMIEENWVLAENTSFAQPVHIRVASYYGAANDVGTPGFRTGGALPVELSHFRPARDKATDAVVITWSTESELNNAGFFIKRSNQRNGEFKVVNAAMIPGAGTTSEKQFYTYTDTTAQPNVVYYYQIEDVSLDGNRQTLTHGIRLRGHVGAAGKATVIWGELKTSHE